MAEGSIDQLLEAIRGEAYSAVIADILDELGRRNQALPAAIHPLWAEAVVFGRARTLFVRDVARPSTEPYRVEFELIDSLESGEVVVAECGANEAALWGELLTTAAQNRGATGAVMNGYCRDVAKVRALGFPVFARGASPADSRGRCEAVGSDEPISCAGVSVAPGDYVFADIDGAVVIPEEIAGETFEKALAKVRGERTVLKALKEGMSAREAYDKWGIL